MTEQSLGIELRLQQMGTVFLVFIFWNLKEHALVFYYVSKTLFLLALSYMFVTLFTWLYILSKLF